MTGGVRGRLETVLSRGGERLQPPWLPHAMEVERGRAEVEDGGEVAISQLPVTHRLLLLIALQIAAAAAQRAWVSKVGPIPARSQCHLAS